MPWTVSHVDDHIKGLSDKQREVWVKVANSALARCKEGGGSDEKCEGSAIRQANAVAKNVGESMATEDACQLALALLEAEIEPTDNATEGTTSEELLGDLVPLVEKALRKDGSARIKLIEPGWGSSGYYSAEVLARDGPKIYPGGSQMFWDHPTESEERERPERSLKDLAGRLTSAAKYDSNGPDGPGLYADAEVFSRFREPVQELAPHIGLSIRAFGRRKTGEAEGRKGKIIQELVQGKSVDFVTKAGAGGKVVELFEAARGQQHEHEDKRRDDVTEEEAKALREANEALTKENSELKAKLAQLEERDILRGAQAFVADKLAATEMPDITRARLTEALSQNPPVKDGKLDEEALAKTVESGVTNELEYLAKINGSGQIKGMGTHAASGDDSGPDLKESFLDLYRSLGNSEEEAQRLAVLAARGR